MTKLCFVVWCFYVDCVHWGTGNDGNSVEGVFTFVQKTIIYNRTRKEKERKGKERERMFKVCVYKDTVCSLTYGQADGDECLQGRGLAEKRG